MESGRRRILAQISDSGVRADEWLVGGALPSEQRAAAARRLGLLGLLTAGTFVGFAFVYSPGVDTSAFALLSPFVPLGVATGAIGFSLAVFVASRRKKIEPRFLLNLGVVYQIVMANFIGIMDNLGSFGSELVQVRGWSGVAVWIIIFAVIVPSTPLRTIWISSIAALMDPLSLYITFAWGNPLPAAELMLPLFAPTFVALVTAVAASGINYRLGRKIHDAQAMGSYQLVELLGRGGMGEVWRARHKMLARPAAIKVIRAGLLADSGGESIQQTVRRFEREAQATALLESEHTVELYDFGISTDQSFYYVMELLDGVDLEQLIRRFGSLPPERAVHLLLQTCESLAEAHESGLVHRDIKPSNVYVCRKALKYDFVKVLDFGLVRAATAHLDGSPQLTRDGAITGTPAYMAPETIDDTMPIDGRTDLYALGCVAYWLVSGGPVFEAQSAMQMVVSHASAEPVRLSTRAPAKIPAALEELVHSCLEKDPARRPQTAQELSARLAAVDFARDWTQERAREWWQTHLAQPGEIEVVDPMGATKPPS